MSDNRAEWLEGIVESVDEPTYHESDPAEILEISTTLLDWLEPKIRADERERIVAWLRSLKSQHGIIKIQHAAQMIEKGTPS